MRSPFLPAQRPWMRWVLATLLSALTMLPGTAAPVPTKIQFQGRIVVDGVPFDGTGRFKFALLAHQESPPAQVVVWTHDGTTPGLPGEPASILHLPVSKGLYSVALGDTSVPNMSQPITHDVLSHSQVVLRVWFDDGVRGLQRLTPDQPLTSVGYALIAQEADTARVAQTMVANPALSGTATVNGNIAVGSILPTERLNVDGNIKLANNSDILGLDQLIGWDDLRLYGDSIGGPDLFVAADGRVGIGTIALNAKLTVAGPDSDGVTGGIRIESGGQYMVLDGNEIDSNGTLVLNYNVPHPIVIGNGGGNVSIGSLPPDERLVVQGNIRLADDSDIRGLDDLYGHNDLRLWGDSVGGPDLQIGADGNVGHRAIYNNVSYNIRGKLFEGETQFLRVEDELGISVLEVQSDRDVFIVGDFHVNGGSKNFVIDHPLAPADKILRHNTVEGPDFYTFYQGRVRLDENGEAWAVLPDYFEALNTTPQYQLTCVGGHAPVYVADEVVGNRFRIAGGRPGLQVCWQVTAVRNDPYVRDHPYQAELDKDPDEKGSYYYPEGYKAGKAQSVHRNRRAEIR